MLFREGKEIKDLATRNCLLLNLAVERFFDEGLITIVPASNDINKTISVVRALGKKTKNSLTLRLNRTPATSDDEQSIQNKDQQGRKLRFLKSNRLSSQRKSPSTKRTLTGFEEDREEAAMYHNRSQTSE